MMIYVLPKEHSLLCQIATQCGSSEEVSKERLVNLERASSTGNFEIINEKNPLLGVMGYITWGRLSKESLLLIQKFGHENPYPKYDHELHAGKLMYILDVAFSRPLTMAEFRAFVRKHKFVFAYRGELVMYSIKGGRVVKTRSASQPQGIAEHDDK